MSSGERYCGNSLYDSDCEEAQLNQKIVEYYLEVNSDGKFLHPPSNDDELDEYVQIAYGVRFPRKVLTPGHKSPFQFLSDLFFERVKTALGFANRTGGKTYIIATLNHLDMTFKEGCEISSAGATRDQANRCYNYFRSFNSLPFFVRFCEHYVSVTGRAFFEPSWSIQSHTDYGNRSKLEIITGSEKGLRGPHPNKSRIDEVDEIPWSVLQTGLSMSKSSPETGIRGQDVFTSTRQYDHGSMQRMLDEAKERGIEVYEWNVFDIVERCTRNCVDDPEHGTCPIIQMCNGKAHSGDGYYLIEDFIGKARLLDKEAFDVQWRNTKPSKEKLVYSMFDPQRHIMTPGMLKKMFGVEYPSMHWRVVSGLDFGSSPGNPFVYLKTCELPNGAILVFYEYVGEQRLLKDHATAIKRSKYWTKNELIYGDRDLQECMELMALGIRVSPASKGQNSISVGIDKISELLLGYPPKHDPMLYVWEDCKYTLSEFSRYQWPVLSDGKVNTRGTPKQGWDHAMDALRYRIYTDAKKSKSGPKYTTRQIVGI